MKALFFLLAVALISPAMGQAVYKWQHPWFKKEITSPTPPTWPYHVIEEKNGVVLVEVTPPGAAVPKTVEPSSAIPPTEPMPTRFRYIDPETKKSVTSHSPPTEYEWEKKRIEGDGTVFLKIIGRNSDYHPSPPAIAESRRLQADFDIEQHCAKVSQSVGGSYRIEQTCRDRAREAKRQIESMSIPLEIERNCTRIAGAVGGSYTIMKSCIEREIEAKANLH
jgi:hypothetical protein